MSDYLFMLENHLSVDQNRVVAQVQALASQAGMSLFLTGGAMRDMLGGFHVRDLDFTVEGNALKLGKELAAATGARIVAVDELRRSMELVFSGWVTAGIAMARQEQYPRPGAKPLVTPGTIQEDLRGRDFTVNAIALSLSRASRGLLIDPTNGLADIGRRELRAVHSTALYDDPSRLLRYLRLRVRLGYETEEKTKGQYAGARAAQMERHIGRRALGEELRHIAEEPSPAELIRTLEQEGLLHLFCGALTGSKLNRPGLVKLERVRRAIPPDAGLHDFNWGHFLYVLAERLGPKDKAALIRSTDLRKSEVTVWQALPGRARKLERELKSPRLKKPSQIYAVLAPAAGDQILFLLYQSPVRLVHDRIKNYFQKYLPLAQQVTDADVQAAGATPRTFAKVKADLIAARLDGRNRKPSAPPVEVLRPEPPPRGRRPMTRT